MTWLAPAALLGVLAAAFPILIHMMGRGRTTVIRFPSLRFLESSRILPARRTRIHDMALLVLRAGAIVAAAVALAQPFFRAQHPASMVDAGVARVVVLDTSASMQRSVQSAVQSAVQGAAATRAAEVGERVADSLATDAERVAVVRAADLRIALEGAAAWAATQSGRVEIAVVSDFQRGALDSAAIATIDVSIGIQFHRVRVAAELPTPVRRTRQGGSGVSARIAFVGDRTDVEWSVTAPSARAPSVQLWTGAAPISLVTATRRGAEAVGVAGVAGAPDAGSEDVAVIFPGGASRAANRPTEQPLSNRRQATIVARLLSDPLLHLVAGADSPLGRVAATNENGRPLLSIVSRAPLGSAASALLLAAVERASSIVGPVSELEPEFIADSTLASWQRAAGDRPAVKSVNPADPPEFDGRWFWILALFFLGVETVLRRAPRYMSAAVTSTPANDRVSDAMNTAANDGA